MATYPFRAQTLIHNQPSSHLFLVAHNIYFIQYVPLPIFMGKVPRRVSRIIYLLYDVFQSECMKTNETIFSEIECTLTTRFGSLRLCLHFSLRMPARPQSSNFMHINAVASSRKRIFRLDRPSIRRWASNETHTIEQNGRKE